MIKKDCLKHGNRNKLYTIGLHFIGGILCALAVTLIALFLLSWALFYYPIPKTLVQIYITLVYPISCCLGGKWMGKGGVLAGICLGSFYFSLLYGISLFCFSNNPWLVSGGLKTISCLCLCIFGAILGIVCKKGLS